MVSPADTAMVSESGEERRRFVNAVLSQMDRGYLSDVQQYNRYLLQRNKLLKAGVWDEPLLGTFDERLAALATPIYERRAAFRDSLLPIVQQYYREISGGREQVGIEYRSDLASGNLAEILAVRRERDRRRTWKALLPVQEIRSPSRPIERSSYAASFEKILMRCSWFDLLCII